MDLKKASSFVFKNSVKLVIAMLLLMVLYIIGTKAFDFGEAIFAGSDIEYSDGEAVVITIPVGATTSEVGQILMDNGLIDDSNVFKVQAILFEAKFTAGNYTLRTSYDVEEIIEALKGQPETTENE